MHFGLHCLGVSLYFSHIKNLFSEMMVIYVIVLLYNDLYIPIDSEKTRPSRHSYPATLLVMPRASTVVPCY